MNLKEAFRFQNKLQQLITDAKCMLHDEDNLTQVETTYLRKKVMPDAENETVMNEISGPYHGKGNELMAFLMHLLGEKEKLARAIRDAKAKLAIDLDSEISLNQQRRETAMVFHRMASLRATETTQRNGGTGYRFNAEGNQVAYRCDTKTVTTICFDRNIAKKHYAQLNQTADAMSMEIDKCMILALVDYLPPFDVNDAFSDLFEAFTA